MAQSVAGAGIDDPDQTFYENYSCKSNRNYTHYCDPEVEKMIDQQSMETDLEKRKKLVWEIDQQIAAGGGAADRVLHAQGDLLAARGQGAERHGQQHPTTAGAWKTSGSTSSGLLRARAERVSSSAASASRSSAVRNRPSQIVGLPLCSANCRYQAANSRNFAGSSTSLAPRRVTRLGGTAQHAAAEPAIFRPSGGGAPRHGGAADRHRAPGTAAPRRSS